MSQVYYNGRFLDETQVGISPADRSFLIGEGLFETMRAYQGCVVFLKEHLERLFEGAGSIDLRVPVSKETLTALLSQTLQLNGLAGAATTDAVIRIYITPQGSRIGDLDSAPVQINLLISCQPFRPFDPKFYEQGASCLIAQEVYAEKGLMAHLKSVSYLNRVLARRMAQARGALEGLLKNSEGYVTEGSGSNLFIVKQGLLQTPPLKDGLLAGVTRDQILKIAHAQAIPFVEKSLSPQDLYTADEVFITSTLKEVLPIRQIDDRLIPSTPGKITQQIAKAYQERVAEEGF